MDKYRNCIRKLFCNFYLSRNLFSKPVTYIYVSYYGDFFWLMFKLVFEFECPTWNSKIEPTLLKILSISKRRTTVKVSSRSTLWNRIFERFFNQIFSSTLTKFSITQPKSCFVEVLRWAIFIKHIAQHAHFLGHRVVIS